MEGGNKYSYHALTGLKMSQAKAFLRFSWKRRKIKEQSFVGEEEKKEERLERNNADGNERKKSLKKKK